MKEPTGDQCTKKEKVFEDEDRVGYAVWYPQMGGYVGKTVALFDKHWKESSGGVRHGGCIDVFVWHDGDWPFGGENPREIHHCEPEQFIEFGEAPRDINNLGRNQ